MVGNVNHKVKVRQVRFKEVTIKDLLITRIRANNITNWSNGLGLIQWYKNIFFHRTIKMEPYKALIGIKPKIGLG